MEVFLQYVLHSSHCWDNYQWKWGPRLILFLILRIMLPIIWERFKGVFRLFPSHSHNYTAMVTWAGTSRKKHQLCFGSCVNDLLHATRKLGIVPFSSLHKQAWVSRFLSVGLVQIQMCSTMVQLLCQLTCVGLLMLSEEVNQAAPSITPGE